MNRNSIETSQVVQTVDAVHIPDVPNSGNQTLVWVNKLLLLLLVVVAVSLIVTTAFNRAEVILGAIGLVGGIAYYIFRKHINAFFESHLANVPVTIGLGFFNALAILLGILYALGVFSSGLPSYISPDMIASEGETLVLVSDFRIMDSSGGTNPILNIYSTLEEVPEIRTELLDEVSFSTSEEARHAGEAAKAALVVWGWSIEGGVNVKYELMRDIQISSELSDQDLFPSERIFNHQQFPEGMTTFIQNGLDAEFSTSFALGLLALSEQNVEDAQANFLAALDALNKLPETVHNSLPLGEAYFALAAACTCRPISPEMTDLSLYTKALEFPLSDAMQGEVYSKRGNSYMFEGRLDEALEDYNRALEINPDSPSTLNNRGGIYFLRDRTDEALEDLNRAIMIDDQFSVAYANRAIIFETQGKFTEAIDDLTKSIEFGDPASLAELYGQRASIRFENENYDEALLDVNLALQQDSDLVSLYLLRGNINASLGNFDAVIEDMDKYISFHPEAPQGYVSKGQAFTALYHQASLPLQERLENNNEESTEENLRRLDVIESVTQKAIKSFSTAIEMDSNYIEAYKGRAYLYLVRGYTLQAINDFEYILNHNPNDFATYGLIGQAYQRINQDAKALEAYRRHIELAGDQADPNVIEWVRILETPLLQRE